jgi:hypothetical protein
MKKLRIGDLEVLSFSTTTDAGNPGTVAGHEIALEPAASCADTTCQTVICSNESCQTLQQITCDPAMRTCSPKVIL